MSEKLSGYLDRRYTADEYKVQYTGPTGVVLRASHLSMEKGIPPEANRNVFEVGGGAQPHFYWMDTTRLERMTISDDISVHQAPLDALRKKFPASAELILHDYKTDPDFKLVGSGYSRVVAANVLEHIHDPEKSIVQWSRMLAPDGILSIVIPCDPGWLWRLGQLASHKTNHPTLTFEEYDLLMSREHVNSAQRLLKIVRYYYPNVRTAWFPAMVPVVDFNLNCTITCRKSDFRS